MILCLGRKSFLSIALILATIFCPFFSSPCFASDGLISLGERLFNDGRFSRFFWKESQGRVNAKLKQGEPHLDVIMTPLGPRPSPFAGQTTSCASCHMVDQAIDDSLGLGMRTYADYSPRVTIPGRNDSLTHAQRNTPMLVGIGSPFLRNRISHWDGEFFDHSETVLGNFTGRNMGWLFHEKDLALKNIIKVLREDDGSGHLGPDFGGSYTKAFLSERIDLKKASDQEVLNAVITAVSTYLNDLDFQTNDKGEYTGSPFDQFLLKNGFSTIPNNGETPKNYTQRLREFLSGLKQPQFIQERDFPSHGKSFGFGHREFQGAKIFFDLPNHPGNKGACFQCHQAPTYSDQSFHNIGTTQAVYDEFHGFGAFLQKYIPKEEFRGPLFHNEAVDKDDPQKFDLGVWNFFGRNKKVTQYLNEEFCQGKPCPLEMMIGRMKTPSLRDLGHSNPYFSHGQMADLFGVLAHYMKVGVQAQQGLLRNPDPHLKEIRLNGHGLRYLERFLNSLNEDYE